MKINVPLEYSTGNLGNLQCHYYSNTVVLRNELKKITSGYCGYRYVYLDAPDNDSSKLEHGIERSTYPSYEKLKGDNLELNKYTNPYNCKYNIFLASNTLNNSCKSKPKKIEWNKENYKHCDISSCKRKSPCLSLIADHIKYNENNDMILMPNYWLQINKNDFYFDVKKLEFVCGSTNELKKIKIDNHKSKCDLNKLVGLKKVIIWWVVLSNSSPIFLSNFFEC